MNDKQIQRMAAAVVKELKSQDQVTFKTKDDVILQKAVDIIKADLARERELDAEVNRMMDELEEQNPGEFQRYKMFPLLKKRLAKEKGIIL